MSPADARSPHLFFSCGDASGDRLAARVAAAVRRRRPGVRISALGGERLAAAGARIVVPSERVAVMGFSDIVRHLPALWRARRAVRDHLVGDGVDLFIPVDFPGFNVPLARFARRRGLPVCYLVAPQLWAWGGWRLDGLRRAVDCLGTILPFETAYFHARGLPVRPLGHPLLADYPPAAGEAAAAAREARLRDPAAPWTLLLLPGSRRQEAVALGTVLADAAERFRRWAAPRPVRAVVSVTPATAPLLAGPARAAGLATSDAPLPELLAGADLALVCSGTASLETALAGVPHVVVYRTRRLDYLVARRLVRVRHIALANLVLDRRAVPERIQAAAAPARLATDLARWAQDPVRRRRFREAVAELRRRLAHPRGEPFAAAAADALLETLDRARGGEEDGRGA